MSGAISRLGSSDQNVPLSFHCFQNLTVLIHVLKIICFITYVSDVFQKQNILFVKHSERNEMILHEKLTINGRRLINEQFRIVIASKPEI